MTNEVIIEPYQYSENEDQEIESLLNDEPFFLDLFHFRKKQGCDQAWAARYNDKIVGIISHAAGQFKYTRFLEFVAPDYRRRGIGTRLIKIMDEYYTQTKLTEQVRCSFPDAQRDSDRFLANDGFTKYCSSYNMERTGEKLPEYNYTIRHYTDDDFIEYSNIINMAFWILREKVEILPNFYSPPNEKDRKNLADNAQNIYLLIDHGIIAAISKISGNELHLLAVRPDLQSRGYGRALATHAINEIISRGEKIVELNCVVGNPAFYLYESLGFKALDMQHEYIKYYLPDSRMKSPPGLTTPEAIVDEFNTYGKLRQL